MREIFQSESCLHQEPSMTRLSTVNVTKQLLSPHNFNHLLFGHAHYVNKRPVYALYSTAVASMTPVNGNESLRRITLLMKALQRLNLPLFQLFLFQHCDSLPASGYLLEYRRVSPPEQDMLLCREAGGKHSYGSRS